MILMENLNIKPVRQQADETMLHRWYELNTQLAQLREEEMNLRKAIFDTYFQEAKEGVNNHTLPDGFVLKGKRVVNRTIDKGALNASIEGFRVMGILVDEVVDWKPSLKVSAYRKLTHEQQKVFDSVLVVKDGTPGLEIVPGAKK
jgi:hypothetical protein